MSWLHLVRPDARQDARLDAATQGLLAAQADVTAEARAVAASAAEAREAAETCRAELGERSARVRRQSLHTGYALGLVEEAISRMDRSADHRAQREH